MFRFIRCVVVAAAALMAQSAFAQVWEKETIIVTGQRIQEVVGDVGYLPEGAGCRQFCYDAVLPEDQIWEAAMGKKADVCKLPGSLSQVTSRSNSQQRAEAAQAANNQLMESTSFLGYLINTTFLLQYADGGTERFTFSRYAGQVQPVAGTLTQADGVARCPS